MCVYVCVCYIASYQMKSSTMSSQYKKDEWHSNISSNVELSKFEHTCILMSPNKEVKFALLEVAGGAALLLLVTDNPSNIVVVGCCYGEQ